jgi:hypothetical protein
MTEPANIRTTIWERNFPGCSAEFKEIFDGDIPTLREIAVWKQEWAAATPHKLILPSGDGTIARVMTKIKQTANTCGIHPYYYSIWSIYKGSIELLFYSGEHMIMFKLAWQ